MKNKSFIKKLLVLLVVLITCIPKMWGAITFSGGYVYFDNTNTNWSDGVIEVVAHQYTDHDYIGCTTMSLISGTNNLYYAANPAGSGWGSIWGWRFMSNASAWGSQDCSEANLKKYATHYTASDNSNGITSGYSYLCYGASSSNNCALTRTSLGNSATQYTSLNYTQTLNQTLSSDGGSTYSASTASLATVTVSSKTLNGRNSTTNSSGTIGAGYSSTTCSAARTATVTYTVSDVVAGYTFVGWYDGNTQKSTNTTYTYNATGAKTITARFRVTTYSIAGESWTNSSAITWDASSTQKLSTTDGVTYSVTMSNEAASAKQFKLLKNESWDGAIAYDTEGVTKICYNGTLTDAGAGQNHNFTLTPYLAGDVEISYNTSSKTLTITCEAPLITFNKASGSGGSDNQKTYSGMNTSDISTPSRSGYAFQGYWSDDATPIQVINSSGAWIANKTGYTQNTSPVKWETGLNANHTFTAHWNANNYTITLDNQSATTAGTTKVTATFDASTNLTSAITKPTKTGYIFGGYFTGTGGSGTQIIGADGNFIASAGGGSTYTDANKKWKYAGNITLKAYWIAITVSATISPSTGATGATKDFTFSITSNVGTGDGYDVAVYSFGTVNSGEPNTASYLNSTVSYNASPKSYTASSIGGFSTAGNYTTKAVVLKGGTVQATSVAITYSAGDYYTVSFNMQGHGSDIASQNILSGSTATTPSPAPTATGYTFGGWYQEPACTNAYNFSTSVTTNKTLYAKWTANNYTVTFDKQSGSGGDNSVSATYDADMPSATMPTRTGYTFGGYYTEVSGGGTKYYNANGTSARTWNIDDDTDLYAQWTERTVTVSPTNSYDAGTPGYSNPTATNSGTIGITSSSTLTAQAAGTGYTFAGWTLSDNIYVVSGTPATDREITIRHKTGDGTAVTATAKYNEVLTSDWHIVGTPTSVFHGSSDYGADSDNMLRKASGSSTADAGSVTINVTALGANNDSYQFKVNNSSTTVMYGWSNSDYYYMNAGATKTTNVYSADSHPLYFIPDALGNYVFAVDWSGTYPSLTVTWPTSYAIQYSKGTVNGSSGNITAKYNTVAFSSNTKIQSGQTITLIAPDEKEGYSWAGWFTNNAGTGDALSTNKTYTPTVSAARNYYACYTINNHTITHSASTNGSYTIKVGSAAAVSTNTTADYGTTITLASSPSTGYHFGSWSVTKSPSGSVTVSSNQFTMPDANVTVAATFTANTWYVRFNANSGTGSMSNESFTYNASAKALTTNAFTRTGYTFKGWATSQANADAGIVTYEDKATVRNLTTTNNGIVDLFAVWEANTYTVDFDVNGGTASTPDSKEVTFGSAYGELPTGMTHASQTFKGWYTLSSAGTQVTASTTVSTASDHTLYAQYEPIYQVNVDFKCGDAKLYPSTSVNASETALAAEISAPEILGYEFSSWSGSNATFGSTTSATTTVKATAATTITANYTAIPTVYFKNNLGWEKVYVTFDCNWVTAGGKSVPSNNTKPYFEMEQLGTSDIFSCRIPDAYVTSAYAGWKNNIAFDNHGFAATSNVGTNTAFNAGEFLGRGDFDPTATMFIPYDGDSETRNGGTYFRTGCWMKYNSTDPGYKVYVNTYKEGSGGSAVAGTPVLLTAGIAGGFEFKAKVYLGTANYTYGFMLHKEYQKNSDAVWYTNTAEITAETNTLPWHFYTDGASENGTRCGVHTSSTGDYEFTVSFATGRPVVDVTYPVEVGDWKLIYKDRATWSNGAHSASWYHPSRVIKAEANAEDIISFFVSKATGASAAVELHKCTAIDGGTGAQTWTKQSDVTITSITKTGIYNFKVSQDGSKVASVTVDGGYDGNFYIRTDASDGGWSNYKTSGTNAMTYSEYAEENSGFTHYFMRYVTSGSNIKFVIANDYNECISDTLEGDTYTGEYIAANGNVRFMWDHRTNKVSRAYISGSAVVSDRFLVLEGDAKMFDESGNALNISGLNANEINFTDDQNWIYEATVKAQPTARVKLTAKYNNKVQYFYGSEGARSDETTELLLGGSGTDKYKMRIVYDFKTNRLLRAFIPEGTITTDLAINADLMIIREHQGEAQQIQFSGSGALSSVKTVYGAMKFNKYTVNGKSKAEGHASTGESQYKRDLFYISFPFDVKLSDAFGFGTYGKHWILEYYDGKNRAKNGYWADSKPNWKFVTPAQRSSFTMKAFEGYILALDLDEMTESSSVWNNNVEDVYIYFPSDGDVGGISATSRTVDIDQDGYQCTIGPRFAGGDDRRQKDSYWHCIGVPSFANYSSDLTPTSEDATTIDWRTGSLPYLYEWNSSNNTVSVTSSATFSFKATYSYLVQYSGEHIYWSSVNTPSSIVARERKAPKNVEFRMELQQNEQKVDQAFVRLTEDENVTTGYDFNYDLSKEFNKSQTNLYTMVTTIMEEGPSITEVAANVQPMIEQTTVIPVGVIAKTIGDYTFAIPDGTEGIGVTLVDTETGVRTSLSALDYTVNLSAGTYNDRFVLEISPIKQTPTGMETVDGQNTDVRKVLIDGILYIVKDGKMYDATGALVK